MDIRPLLRGAGKPQPGPDTVLSRLTVSLWRCHLGFDGSVQAPVHYVLQHVIGQNFAPTGIQELYFFHRLCLGSHGRIDLVSQAVTCSVQPQPAGRNGFVLILHKSRQACVPHIRRQKLDLCVCRHAPLRMETRTSTSADTHLYVWRHAPLRMQTRTSTSANTQLCARAYAHHTESMQSLLES